MIWGDAVNIASRMEQIGLPQQVNISQTTYELIKNKIACTHQGKFWAKNKGDLNVYTIDV
jgi:adenylate cyclase